MESLLGNRAAVDQDPVDHGAGHFRRLPEADAGVSRLLFGAFTGTIQNIYSAPRRCRHRAIGAWIRAVFTTRHTGTRYQAHGHGYRFRKDRKKYN